MLLRSVCKVRPLSGLLLAPCAVADSFNNGFEDGLPGWEIESADPASGRSGYALRMYLKYTVRTARL